LKELKELKKVEQYVNQCMKCGFCAFFCPVYQQERTETSLARGKNYLAKLAITGEQEFTKEMAEIIDKCLLCKRCVANCPSKTQIDRVVIAARAENVNENGLHFPWSFAFRKIMASKKSMARYARLAQKMQWLMPKTEGKVRHLPDFIKGMGKRNFPELAKTFLSEQVKPVYKPANGQVPKMRVGYFMGCATDFVFPEIGLKLIDFMTRQGIEIVVPESQSCCGVAIFANGEFETARMLADQNAKAFEGLDYVITACGTCSSTLKDYTKYLSDTDERKTRYEALEKKVKDSTEFIIDVLKMKPEEFKLRKEFEGKTATWHDPCHLIRYQNIKDQPRAILKGLKGLKYAEMPNADMCCGMGGTFSVHHYDISKKIGDEKADGIKATNADIVVTACPGCMFNLVDITARNKMPQKVYHFLELIE
jgi:glycolate oxidase iron-sulfur subunit